MAAYSINLISASYDPSGVVTAVWERARITGATGFWARIDGGSGYQGFYVRDKQAVSVLIPVELEPNVNYTLILYATGEGSSVLDDVHSKTIPIVSGPN